MAKIGSDRLDRDFLPIRSGSIRGSDQIDDVRIEKDRSTGWIGSADRDPNDFRRFQVRRLFFEVCPRLKKRKLEAHLSQLSGIEKEGALGMVQRTSLAVYPALSLTTLGFFLNIFGDLKK
jgi:hypothetical protein